MEKTFSGPRWSSSPILRSYTVGRSTDDRTHEKLASELNPPSLVITPGCKGNAWPQCKEASGATFLFSGQDSACPDASAAILLPVSNSAFYPFEGLLFRAVPEQLNHVRIRAIHEGYLLPTILPTLT